MPRIFDGFNSSASWLDDFINSQAADDVKKESLAFMEDDIIKAVKTKRYSGLDEALADLRQRVGLTEKAIADITLGITKKATLDAEWHAIHGTMTEELKTLASAKLTLAELASEFDDNEQPIIADAIDNVLEKLPVI